eukprot:TRINITY_DN48810_c0_g1_i1.p1 TRINITY_DN48810_c0_g1~~TRINITY_DN48810_c0_g1_i1.p1  ORF type:complete len:970 (+),score=226.71 TRINITY_DN48810_c0_g1_i1:414-2912(+)
MARKALLTPDDFEVYWFEPPKFLDEDTRDFLLKCIRETNRKLIDENRKLQSQIQQINLYENGLLPTVLRRLKQQNSVAGILRELWGLARSRPDTREFTQTAMDLLGLEPSQIEQSASVPVEPASERAQEPDLIAQEELTALRARTKEQETLIEELRSQLSAGIDVRLERERADQERQRADLVQQRAERLEQQQKALKSQLRTEPSADRERLKRMMTLSVNKLSEAMQALTPSGSLHCTPNVSPCARRTFRSPEKAAKPVAEEATFDDALMQLDSVATGFEAVAQDVLAELQDLRSRVAVLEALKKATEATPKAVTPKAISCEEFMAPDNTAAEALERELAEERAAHAATKERLEEERANSARLREKLAEAKSEIADLQGRLDYARGKARGLREKLKSLKILHGIEDNEGEDEDDEDDDFDGEMDFMVPYRKRAKMAAGRPRWEVLSEDAACARKRREYLSKRTGASSQPEPEAMRNQEVFAAFGFLSGPSAPGNAKQQRQQKQLQQLQQLQQHQGLQQLQQQLQPHRGPHRVKVALPGGASPLPPQDVAVPAVAGRSTTSTASNSRPTSTQRRVASEAKELQPKQGLPVEEVAACSEVPRHLPSNSLDASPVLARSRQLGDADALGIGEGRRAATATSTETSTAPSTAFFNTKPSTAPATPLFNAKPARKSVAHDHGSQMLGTSSSGMAMTSSGEVQETLPSMSPSTSLRPARSLRLAAQSSVQSSPVLVPETASKSKNPLLQKAQWSLRGSSPDADWMLMRRSSGVPLTNAAKSARPTKCTDSQARQSQSNTSVGASAAADTGFVPELMPGFPVGNTRKAQFPSSWLAGGA